MSLISDRISPAWKFDWTSWLVFVLIGTLELRTIRNRSAREGMVMIIHILVVIGALVASAGSGLATQQAADQCAKRLPTISRAIYDGALPNIRSVADGRSAVINQTEKLVSGGQLSREDARPAAEAAGRCLELILK
jgi:hypothetical protein